ncbi:aldose 1-epimerase family protein [Dyadobacter aurulentus]|uniref:aldose 1-epimerase family protein n=1 Tax=Dyadobacter sp. UC 10 TaxID=2605428 RepID=UPI0011F34DCE|nr:aldose 1-epimerase family protein [Dyadobacter sp. UC 10]KAA0993617.1 aldose 1-epimerase family protein [Dyadobacter sp. UC 10]
MEHKIANEYLQITIKETGAELCRIQSVTTGKDFMWNADPAVWSSHAPVLFPVIGAIKNGYVRYQGQEYAVPRHGIVRNNSNVKLAEKTASSLTFALKFSEETLKIYPFEFQFEITYRLKAHQIIVDHRVINHGNTEMLFSLGGHPAFKCPLNADETYQDYYLEFEAVENDSTWLLTKDGLVGTETRKVFDNTNTLHLNHQMFENDALIFKHLVSNQVSLRSTKSAQVVTIHFPDFPYLGVWAKTNGNFVCIEPWLGIADSADSDQDFETKEGLLRLAAGQDFEASFAIEISE